MQEYLIYLACYGAFVIFVILVQVLTAAQQVGLSTLAGNREALTLTGLAGRMERAANNSLLALALVSTSWSKPTDFQSVALQRERIGL